MDRAIHLRSLEKKTVSILAHPCFNLRVSRRMDPVAKLCPACGLCCNGVLFGDVELRSSDDRRQLDRLGLDLFRKGRKTAFRQPCACFDGVLCRIYKDRPGRCRTFECRLLKRVQSGSMHAGVALKVIRATKEVLESARGLVRQLGNSDEQLPLNQRCAVVISQPIDLASGGDLIKLRRRLMFAASRLMQKLDKHFMS